MSNPAVGLQRECNGKLRGGITGKGFRPGRSGNPSGKRKGSVSLASALARSLTSKDADAICRKLISLAKQGDVPALKLLFDRLDGPLNLFTLAAVNTSPPQEEEEPKLTVPELREVLAKLKGLPEHSGNG
jgi:hypothetical protein